MKTTLFLENGIRLSANLDEQKGLELIREFVCRLPGNSEPVQLKTRPELIALTMAVPELGPESTPELPMPILSRPKAETKLLVFRCDLCNSLAVVKVSRETDIGDIVVCRCGRETQISEIHVAFGDCVNCGTKFFHMGMVNCTKELQCRSCRSPIDLVAKSDGTMTGVHNLRH